MLRELSVIIFVILLLQGCLYPSVKGPISGKTYYAQDAVPNDIYHGRNYYYLGEEYKKECREYYLAQNPYTPTDIQELIRNGRIQIGMTKEQVTASVGKPNDINRTVTAFGVHEQWVYGTFGPYLYFDGNILTGSQTHR